jgi:hypothetical protein
MFKIDFSEASKMALSALGALLLTAGAMTAAAGPSELGRPAQGYAQVDTGAVRA